MLNKKSQYLFGSIEIYSGAFEGPFEHQTVCFEVLSKNQTDDGKISLNLMGTASLLLKPLMGLEDKSMLQLKIMDRKDQLIGKLSFSQPKLRNVFSFLDYKLTMNINFVPIIAVDYSLSNRLFESSEKSLHSIDNDTNNDYISIINHVRHVYKDISQYWMGYGFGGKTCPEQVQASNLFSMSGNMFDLTISYNKVLEKYTELTEKVKLAYPVKINPVLESVIRYAEHEYENYKSRNYYCLIYITPGVIDDIEDTIESLKLITKLPMTVSIVKVNNPNYSDTNDAKLLLEQFNKELDQSERHPLFVIDYEQFKQKEAFEDFEKELITNLPQNTTEYYEPRTSMVVKNKDVKNPESPKKTFASEFNLSLSDSETDSDEPKEEINKNSAYNRPRIRSIHHTNHLMNRKRRLSYSGISEELFIATFPIHCDITPQQLEYLVDEEWCHNE